MTTLTMTSSKSNVQSGSKLNVDQRSSVGTWSTRYAPSVFTFNANWAPTPLRFSASSASTSGAGTGSGSGVSGSRWSTRRQGWEGSSYLKDGSAPARPETDDDGERVSHLDLGFDTDNDDGDGGEEDNEEGHEHERDGRYGSDWRGKQLVRRGEGYGHDDEEYSLDPIPTQERTKFSSASNTRVDSSANGQAALRAYLTSYGFPDGLGYERPPFNTDLSRSGRSSSPSQYSFYADDDDDSDDEYNNNNNHNSINNVAVYPDSNSKFAYTTTSDHPRSHYQNQNPQARFCSNPTRTHSELPSLAASTSASASELTWPTSLEASTALLSSLALDACLVDDPYNAWEALCWDELAPESDSDRDLEEGNDEGGHRDRHPERARQEKQRHSKASTADWTSAPPSPHPVFRRYIDIEDATELGAEINDDSRTISVTENDVETAPSVANTGSGTSSGTGPSTSTSTITRASSGVITTEDSEEWISLTGARAQAARARILPYRHILVPFPTYPHTDVSAALLGLGDGTTRSPVDPVLGGAPPVPVPPQDESGPVHNSENTDQTVRRDEEGMAEVLLAADGVAEGETAPHYGEYGRDQLLTLTERDPPPYDLTYEASSGYGAGAGRMYAETDSERTQQENSSSNNIALQATSSTFPTHSSLPRTPCTRSQLTFPTSPTETDTLPGTNLAVTSPTETETTLTTPGETYYSGLFPHPFMDSENAPLVPSRELQSSSAQEGIHIASETRPDFDEPPYPFPAGGCKVSTPSPPPSWPSPPPLQSQPNLRPRPLPPRPVGTDTSTHLRMGARTTVEAWLSASAAGPYVDGRRLVSSPGSSSGFALGSAAEAPTQTTSGPWPAGSSHFEPRESEEVGHENDETPTNSCFVIRSRSQTHSPSLYHNHVNSNLTRLAAFSERSYSTDALPKLKHNEEKEKVRSLEDFPKSGSESGSECQSSFHVISSTNLSTEGDGIGLQTSRNRKHNRIRSRSGSAGAKSLQRFATRCSTLTRRIGIVAGVGTAGRER